MPIECLSVADDGSRSARLPGRIGILIPAYNEAEHLPALLVACRSVQPAIIMVVDDCSSDRTPEVLAGISGIVHLRNHKNLGKQGTVRRGLREMQKAGLDAVALLDGDGQHDPGDLPRLAALLADFDFVIGARSKQEMPAHRQLSNMLVNLGFKWIGGVDFIDVQSGLRIYRADLARVLAERLPAEGGYALEHESLTLLARHARERGVTLRAAAAMATCRYGQGTSSMEPWHVVQLAFQTIQQALRLRIAEALG